ncbi:hypothetical protein HHJ79_11455, partial [Mobiluncus mulieris]|nr:hypothetical protein [Mobiluncus mulieris]
MQFYAMYAHVSGHLGFKFAVRQWGRVHEVPAGMAGLAIAVAVGGHQSQDAK